MYPGGLHSHTMRHSMTTCFTSQFLFHQYSIYRSNRCQGITFGSFWQGQKNSWLEMGLFTLAFELIWSTFLMTMLKAELFLKFLTSFQETCIVSIKLQHKFTLHKFSRIKVPIRLQHKYTHITYHFFLPLNFLFFVLPLLVFGCRPRRSIMVLVFFASQSEGTF